MTARLWVVSELFHPETTSTGRFLTGIAEDLAPHASVYVLCSQPTYSARGVRAPRRESYAGMQIIRCRSTLLNKDVLPLRVLNAVTIAASVFLHALRRIRAGDVALVVTNPPLLPYAIRAAANVRGFRVVLLVHDVYPEVLTATGMARPNSMFVRLTRSLTRRLYRSMSRIVVLGRDMLRLVAARRGERGDGGIVIIPNWGDTETIRPAPTAANALRQRLGLGGKFVVQLMGNLGRTHGLETTLAAAEQLHGDPIVHFLVVGWGARERWLTNELKTRGLTNVTLLPPCSAEELATFLTAADVALIPFRSGMAGVSVPSRMYNVMAAGVPIIAAADDASELAMVVREAAIGWVVPPEAPEELVRTIHAAQADRAALAAMGQRARSAAEQHYARKDVTDQYRRLLEPMLQGSE